MQRLCRLVLKELNILCEYISANYEEFDKDWMLDNIEKAKQNVIKCCPEIENRWEDKDWTLLP